MKLQALTENNNRLVIDVRHSEDDRETYIISDVPSLLPEQFKELYQMSFDSTMDSWTGYHRFKVVAAQSNYGSDHVVLSTIRFTSNPTKTLKWKEFVTTMKTRYPYEQTSADDFSE